MSDAVVLEQYGKALAGKFANPTIQAYTNCLGELGAWLADHHRTVGGLAGIMQASEGEVRRLLVEFRQSPDLPTKARTHIKAAVYALRTEVEVGRSTDPSPEEIVLESFRDAASTRLAAGTGTLQIYERYLQKFGDWLVKNRPEVGGLTGFVQTEKDDADTLMTAYLDSSSLSTSAQSLLKTAVKTLRAEKDHSTEPSPEEIVLKRFRGAARTRLAASTVTTYESVLRGFGDWLVKNRPEVGGLAGFVKTGNDDAHALTDAYLTSPSSPKSAQSLLKPAVKTLRAEMSHSVEPSPDEIVLARFRDAANTRLAANTVRTYESLLRGFGVWLRLLPAAGGLEAIEDADWDDARDLMVEYRASSNQSDKTEKVLIAAAKALQSRLKEPDEIVLKRFGDAAGPGTASRTISDRQSQLRAFGYWLQGRNPRAGDGHLLHNLLHIQEADKRAVDTVVTEYRSEIAQKSPHADRIAGAVDVLRSVGIALGHYDQAARDGGEPDNPRGASQNRLSAFSFWLAQHHLEVGGLAGIIRAGQADVDMLLRAYSEDTSEQKEFTPKEQAEFKRNIESAVDALRAYCREVSDVDQDVLDQYGQAIHQVGVRDTVQQRDSRRNLIYLRCFSLWLEDSHQGVGLAEIRAGKANLEELINKYCESADAMSPRRKRTLDAIDALRQSRGSAINH